MALNVRDIIGAGHARGYEEIDLAIGVMAAQHTRGPGDHWVEDSAIRWYLKCPESGHRILSVVSVGHGFYELGEWHNGELVYAHSGQRLTAEELAAALDLNLDKPTNPLERRIADAIKLPAS
ncbi:MAG: hypothetical protein HYT16_01990 [DPANN group archaeon]|nr:hypothetical protein [DPANN group archaeon]